MEAFCLFLSFDTDLRGKRRRAGQRDSFTTVSTCLGAAGQILRLVFDPLARPNEGMGNSPVSVRVETVR